MADKGKEKIIVAAMELLLQKEITQITTREVVNKAGVNIALLHYHFKTKNDLFSETIRNSTEIFFKRWIEDNINLTNSSIGDLEKYTGSILETIDKYPTISKSKIHLFLSGVDQELLSFGLVNDLVKIVTQLLPSFSETEIIERIHFLGQILISLRVSTSLIENHTGLQFSIESDRKEYNKKMLKQIFPELY